MNQTDEREEHGGMMANRHIRGPAKHWLVALLIAGGAVALVWRGANWLSPGVEDPRDLIDDLQTLDGSTWFKAYTLASALRDPKHESLKHDEQAAARLAAVLDLHLTAERSDPQRIKLQVFLCRALGEFKTPAVLPALARAAAHRDDEADIDVQRAAIEAFAVLASSLGPAQIQEHDGAMQTLIAAAEARGPAPNGDFSFRPLRSTAAYTLGVVGGAAAIDQLIRLLDDVDTNTRFNAATGLARHGRIEAIPVLLIMLDPTGELHDQPEASPEGRAWKRRLVLTAAIRASSRLAAENPQADVSSLRAAIERLVDADVPPDVSIEARETLLSMHAVVPLPRTDYTD